MEFAGFLVIGQQLIRRRSVVTIGVRPSVFLARAMPWEASWWLARPRDLVTSFLADEDEADLPDGLTEPEVTGFPVKPKEFYLLAWALLDYHVRQGPTPWHWRGRERVRRSERQFPSEILLGPQRVPVVVLPYPSELPVEAFLQEYVRSRLGTSGDLVVVTALERSEFEPILSTFLVALPETINARLKVVCGDDLVSLERRYPWVWKLEESVSAVKDRPFWEDVIWVPEVDCLLERTESLVPGFATVETLLSIPRMKVHPDHRDDILAALTRHRSQVPWQLLRGVERILRPYLRQLAVAGLRDASHEDVDMWWREEVPRKVLEFARRVAWWKEVPKRNASSWRSLVFLLRAWRGAGLETFVNELVATMRTSLIEGGHSTELVDEAWRPSGC